MKSRKPPNVKRKLKFDLALTILVVSSVVIFTGCTRKPVRTIETGGWTLDNKPRATLADYKGKVVVLDFYATWCEPCRAETPRLVQLQKQYQQQGLQIVGLNVGGADDRDQVPAFAKEFGIEYPLGFPDDEFADSLLGDNISTTKVGSVSACRPRSSTSQLTARSGTRMFASDLTRGMTPGSTTT